ncbi:MBL fold metallo-hydrolase [Lacrimispora amygdalina]|uniref:MBL fold metallo-hydrolase n=1 Tax=Lacrimispora amygdalina TaxID=253257 RepID=A0ABQ5ME53_9FIRM
MKLTVLVDNNTLIDKYFLGEPAVSYYIEDEAEKILFDAGYSDVFISNADKLQINLSDLTKIVFSHGHNDHTGGFHYLSDQYDLSHVKLFAHPDVFKEKRDSGESIGSNLTVDSTAKTCNLFVTKRPVAISKNIIFLGEIPNTNSFETRNPIGEQKVSNNHYRDDYILDDSALVYKCSKGLFIITGCSHSGICNIIEYAKTVCKNNTVLGVIGGFHLFNTDTRLEQTIQYFIDNGIRELYPCHCVSFKVKAEINNRLPIHEVGVGLTITI